MKSINMRVSVKKMNEFLRLLRDVRQYLNEGIPIELSILPDNTGIIIYGDYKDYFHVQSNNGCFNSRTALAKEVFERNGENES